MLSHSELQRIYNNLFNETIKSGISDFFAQDMDNAKYVYCTDVLWKMDALIGGIGGYCMPASPVKNPFPAGVKRELYRPLQYARSSIDICDVRIFARQVVENSGMHLEAACRMFLKKISVLGGLTFQNSTLGKAVCRIEKENAFNDYVIDALYDFVKVYNRSKHEVNQDEAKDRMFNAEDAVVSYFATRLLGVLILQKINVTESFKKYEICE
ncbi:MAG: hypothetical protein HDR15_08225 [Lachnospiraceae bacterium]|nr:hypothetical protein [Lachnospiraceae bacterium]